MLQQSQLTTMLDLQSNMNAKVNPQWLTAGYQYLRAAMIEAVEAIEHHGWKWWKAQQKDVAQLQMELVDIWHFALSAVLIQHNGDIEASARDILQQLSATTGQTQFDGKNYAFDNADLLANLELMTGLCAAKRFDCALFMRILAQADMTEEQLFQQYVGKNILNFFRQDHGYKEGSYIKTWQGREDNEHLVEVLEALDSTCANYSEQVYQHLAARYSATN